MGKLIDLTGRVFHRLTALQRAPNAPNAGQARWLCQCECGTEIIVFGFNLVHDKQKSCGCYQVDHPARLRHGYSKTRAHSTWTAIHQRCNNPSNKYYAYYGGRGITVCPEWDTFEQFLADMGEAPEGLTLDRRDNDKGYSKDNCRWATKKQQVRNRRVSNPYTFQGKTQGLADWADEKGLPYKVVWFRYTNMGWREDKLFSPVRKMSPRKSRRLPNAEPVF